MTQKKSRILFICLQSQAILIFITTIPLSILMAQTLNSFLYLLHSLLVLFNTYILPSASEVHNVAALGAKSGLGTDSAKPLRDVWTAACGSAIPSTIYIPKGRYLVGHATFKGPCKSNKISIQIDGELVAPLDYGKLGNGDWIVFDQVDGVSIYGGRIDGRGKGLWGCKADGQKHCPVGAPSLTFNGSNNILISGLTSVNSELYHIVIISCHHVTILGVMIKAPGNSPNTDGIHVQMSTDVKILGTGISTGDDCISVGPGTTDLWVEHVTCGPGHGISIGSLGKKSEEKGVMNVTVKSVNFTGTANGLRIKTWGRPSHGFVRGVVFEHVFMHNVNNPIIIDQNYCPHDTGCPDQNSGIEISDVKYNNIQGSSMNFACSESKPCSRIRLQNIKLTYGNKPAKSACIHITGNASGYVVPPSCL